MFIYSFITGALKCTTVYGLICFQVNLSTYIHIHLQYYINTVSKLRKMKLILAGVAYW